MAPIQWPYATDFLFKCLYLGRIYKSQIYHFDVNNDYIVMFTHTYLNLYSSTEISFKTKTFQINRTHP